MNDKNISRRQFVTISGTAGVGVLSVSGTAEASHSGNPYDHQPDHISIDYPTKLIKKYQPYCRISHLNISPTKMYAARFSSPEHDTDVYAYWTWFVGQEGYSKYDSHNGDREPCSVFVNSETGEVEHVIYSGWHYIKYFDGNPNMYDETHPHLSIARPHHHYYRGDDTDTSGQYVDLQDFRDVLDYWADNGWTVSYDAVLNPWSMQYRSSWWPRGIGGISTREWSEQASLLIAKTDPFTNLKTDL